MHFAHASQDRMGGDVFDIAECEPLVVETTVWQLNDSPVAAFNLRMCRIAEDADTIRTAHQRRELKR